MDKSRGGALFGRRFAHNVWHLSRVYWGSPDARWGGLLLVSAVTLEFGTVYFNLRIARAQGRIMDALENKEPTAFFAAIATFLVVMGGFLLASTYRIYFRQAVEVRWRRGVTAHYLERWVSPRAYCLGELHRGELDNPDQRIAEDIRDFVASALGLSLSLLAAVTTLASFGGMLWTLSRGLRIHLNGVDLEIPGLMMWVAIVFALFSTWVTHVVGQRLVPINFDKLRFEADFRYGLMRFRDHVESVALSRGVKIERRGSLDRFRHVMLNWWQLIRAQRNLALLTGGIGQANSLVPMLVAAPAYFGGYITLGAVVQASFAYGQVSGGLVWFVNAYQEIARWRANIERLSSFTDVLNATTRVVAQGGIRVVRSTAPRLRLVDLRLDAPDGRVLLEGANAVVHAGDRVAVVGPSGVGKTTLFRAIAGIWPFGAGQIEVPPAADIVFVPQRPYFPIGSLRAAVAFPEGHDAFPDETICELLGAFGLRELEGRLDEHGQWEEALSPDEQQRLALVRVLLHKPDWIVLDKATSDLDEPTEKRAYELLAQRLPHATLISVAIRPEVVRYHSHCWTLTPRADGRATLRVA